MQLRKRSNHVNYTENGSPSTARPRRTISTATDVTGNSSDSEDERQSDHSGEGSSEMEISDDTTEVRSAKERPAKRKSGAGKVLGKDSNILVYMKRNVGSPDPASPSHESKEDEDGDDDSSEVKPRKKRKILAEPRTRPVRARKSERVNYKDASSSDEGEGGAKRGGGSSEKSGKGYHRNFPEVVDDDELPEGSTPSNRKKGASSRKIRRVAAPSVESADSPLPPCDDGDGDSVKCYSRRSFKNAATSDEDEDDEQRAGDGGASGEVSRGRSPGESDSPQRNASEPEDEEKSKTSNSKEARRLSKGSINGLASTPVDQFYPKASAKNHGTERPLLSKAIYVVDTFGLRIGSEQDYGPITKRINKVEKILSVRNRSTGAPIFCVKLQGQSYRCVATVLEGQLLKHCPQLLRTFLKRMDGLNRADGHPGDHARSPAFNPQHLKIDRIVTAEKNKRGTRYFVKWIALPYSESTWERDEDLSDDVDAIKRYRAFNRRKKAAKVISSSSKRVFKDGRSLRDYQEEGVSWLDDKWSNGVNCILADEMGLGKTIQSVAMLETLRLKRGIQGPFLVVAPVSTLGHWQREVESLTDMNCVVYSGNYEDREIIREYEFKYDGDSKSSDVKFNVLLTSFEMLMKDQSKLVKISWQFVIVDEAHRLKSRESKTTLSLKQMGVPNGGLLLLTGTPVQNNTKEIFSLLNLLDSERFNSEEDFLTKYGDLKNAEQVKDLQDNVLRPRLLRRMKEDVEKSIPQKEETIVWVELTREQRVYYRAIYENSVGVLLKGSQGNNIPGLRNVAMELRKVCNHPLLCDGIEEDLIAKHSGSNSEKSFASGRADSHIMQKVLQNSSGKMVLVDKLLPMLKEAGNRVLIFSQFTMMLDLLEDYLVYKGYSYERIDGKIRGSDRQAAIDRYSAKDSDIFVFLLSTRAGGLGITLTAADTCLIYDSDWNPQNDLQAMARCHRIGQTKDVRIYRLITRNTYEQKLFECSSRKYGLDEAILGNRLGADGDMEQTVNIESLLKHGAYDMVKEDGDAAAAEFSTQNIHEILEHRTQKRLIGGRGVNTFSVATFISHDEVDTEPKGDRTQQLEKGADEFWQELLPEAYKASKTVKEKVSLSPLGSRRKRAQVRVDYREDPKSVSDDEFDPAEGSGRDSATEESSASLESDEEVGIDSWSAKELKRLEDRLIVLGRNHSRKIQEEAELLHRDLAQIEQVSDFLFQFCHFAETNKSFQISTVSPKISDALLVDQKTDKLAVVQNSDVYIVNMKPDVLAVNQKPDCLAVDQKPDVQRLICKPEEVEKPILAREPLKLREEVLEILPIDCILVNNPQTAVNYRKDGCLLIGDTRRPTAPACIRKAMKSRVVNDRLAKNASRYLQILREREILARAIAKDDRLYLPPRVPVRSKKIPSWWGTQEDLDLMIGVNKHGHREFKKVRMDPSLCFAKRMCATNQAVHSINITENQGLGTTAPVYPLPHPADEGQEWPQDTVLTARLKKLIQLLPSGSGGRVEVNIAIPKSHKRRPTDTSVHRNDTNDPSWQSLSSNTEKSGSGVAGFAVKDLPSVAAGKDGPARASMKDMSAGASVKNLSAGVTVNNSSAGVTFKNPLPVFTVKNPSAGVTVKDMPAESTLKNLSGVTVKDMPAGATFKNLSGGVTVKDVSYEAIPKVKVDGQVLHRKTETSSGKESDFTSRKTFSINPDKKEVGLETSRQRTITGSRGLGTDTGSLDGHQAILVEMKLPRKGPAIFRCSSSLSFGGGHSERLVKHLDSSSRRWDQFL